MSKFTGIAHEHLEPLMPISLAEVEVNQLTIKSGSWIYKATSRDGFYYEGSYGKKHLDAVGSLQCWLYPGPDGSKIVYCYWHRWDAVETQGESVFRLVPESDTSSDDAAKPEEWNRVTKALADAQTSIAPDSSLEFILAHDRWSGHRGNPAALSQSGLYVLFYNSGKIARVGKADPRSLSQRLLDYEPNRYGWFSFRWVGIIPFSDEQSNLITAFEKYLLATLKPPENTRGLDDCIA